jgi:hypothetical protein
MADHQRGQQHADEGQQVLRIGDRQRQARRHEKEIERGHAKKRQQHAGPAPQLHRGEDHAEQIQHHEVGEIDVADQHARNKRDERADRARPRIGGRRRAPRVRVAQRIAPRAGVGVLQQVALFGALRDALAERAAQPARRAAARRAARHQLRYVAHARIADQRRDRIGAGQRGGFRAEIGGKTQRVQRAFAQCIGQPLQLRRFDIHGDPVGLQCRRKARGRAHETRRFRTGPDAHQQPLARLPDMLDRTVGAIFAHLRIDTIGGTPQRQLAQRDQVAFAKEVAHRALGLLRQIHLAVAHPVEQFFGGQIDQRHFVGAIEHAVGHRLPHADARDLADHVVQTLQMLHVDGGVHVDARIEQFIDVLPALRMARAGDVRMCEFVDENQLRLALERGVEIELAELAAAIRDARKRQHVEPFEQRSGFAAAMRLGNADHYVDAFFLAPRGGQQHRIGFADTRRRAEKHLQPAALAPLFFTLQLAE